MRTPILAVLCLAAVLGAGAGCSRPTGGGEARHLSLFAAAWNKCHPLGLYEARVESVTPLADGVRRVVVSYLFNNGMVPDQGRAAMLVNAQGRLASDCVLDLEANVCLCGVGKDWHDGP